MPRNLDDLIDKQVRMAPYLDWEFPQVKDEMGELVPKYPEELRNTGYVIAYPTSPRFQELTKFTDASTKNLDRYRENLVNHIVEKVILDWYDVDPKKADEVSQNWPEAKEGHAEFLKKHDAIIGRFVSEYISRFHYEEKKRSGDSDAS